jgi:predicted metal-dependent peptidase
MQNPILTKAINGLMLSYPFYASMLLRHEIVFDAETKTASTDGKTLRINEEFLTGLTHNQRVTLLAHETEHVCKLHHTRRNDRDGTRWNKACDHAVNNILAGASFEPIPNWLCDERFKDKCAEEIYREMENEDSQGKSQQGQNQSQQQSGQGQPQMVQGEVIGEVTDSPDPSQAEEQAKQGMEQAKALAKRMGKLPEAIDRNLGNVSASGDPRELLARFITEQAQSDYSWQRPNKRYIPHELYVPSLYNKTLGKFVIAVDTSGSISKEEIEKSVSFILSCLDSLADFGSQQSVTVIYCDSVVQYVEELESGQTCNPKGGGGTDFRPPFAHVDKEEIQPAGMIYLTDGECNAFPSAPNYPVLWGLFCACAHFKPPFGETVELFNL